MKTIENTKEFVGLKMCTGKKTKEQEKMFNGVFVTCKM